MCVQGAKYNATVQAGDCFCDGLCSLYRDCSRGAEPINGDPYDVAELVQASYCEYIGYETFYVVNSYPVNYHEAHLLELCKNGTMDENDFLLHTPVSNTYSGIVFKNIFCAICHGYNIDDVRFWKVTLRCYSTPDDHAYIDDFDYEYEGREYGAMTMLDSDYADMNPSNTTISDMIDMCRKVAVFPDDVPYPRQCFLSSDTCPVTWNDSISREMCVDGPQSLVYSIDKTYRNHYCAECDGVGMNAVDCQPQVVFAHGDSDDGGIRVERPRLPGFKPISVLLDFNSQALTIRDRLVKNTRDCGKGAIYDIISNKCRMISCRVGLVLRESKCVPHASDLNKTLANGSHCPLVNINETDYYIFPNGSLVLNQTHRIYDRRSYIQTNDTLQLCVTDFIEDTLSFYGAYDLDVVQGMVSFIGQILSILGLLTLIFIYSCVPPLRTLPGQCLLSLALSLAFAQTAFVAGMFATEFHILCKSLAIFTHFAFLVSFCWMNAMAFDIWNTFRCKFSVATSSISYAGYCLSVPSVIVVYAVINDNIETNLSKPRYGTHFCWIGQKSVLFYYFAMPVVILLICNFAFFGMSICHILNSSGNETVTRRRHSRRKRLILYAKLSTIMGLTWVFGYVGAVTGSSVMWYFCIVFNSLQGLFICIAYLCNSKVRKLLNARLEKSRSRTSMLSTTLSKTFSKQKSKSSSEKQSAKPYCFKQDA